MRFPGNVLKALLPWGLLTGSLLFLESREILNPYWVQIFQLACVVAISALGLNLIYGFNGQFSLAQWGFYGIGAYCAADITYRWINGDSRGLIVVLIGVILAGLVIAGFIWLATKRFQMSL